MLTIQNTNAFRLESPTILTIGTFDGVHLGHQKILARLNELRQQTGLNTVVFTFEPHPRKVLFPHQKDLRLLTLIDEKLALLDRHGVDVTVVYPFSPSFSEMDSEQYIRHVLVKMLNVKMLVIGYDHKFGKNRSGDIHVLRSFSSEYGFEIEEISAHDIDSIAVSSTRIRKALEDGDVSMAAGFLGHNYKLRGTVVKGKQLGRTLGYPTANIETDSPDKLVPRKGIYIAEAEIRGNKYDGMLSVGTNPTTDTDNQVKIEMNIFDFDREIYGETIDISFVKRLREEKKFANLSELKAALDKDKQLCLQHLGKTK